MKTKSPVILLHSNTIRIDVADETADTLNIKEYPSSYNLNREEIRLQTFRNWPHNFITPEKLARTGFYFIGPNNDNAKCYFCKVEIGCWEQDDDEVTEHTRWSQNCPLIRRRNTNNVPIDVSELDRLLPPSTYDVCGPCGVIDVRHGSYAESSFTVTPMMETPTLKRPDHPEYAIEAARFRSFEDWPKTMKQKPKDLSDAGFFYTQKGDRVKCFSCGGGLRDWDEKDVPWEQHVLWFGKCEYLKLIKGQNYIDSILEKKELQDESESGSPDEEANETHMKLVKKGSNSVELTSSSVSDIETSSSYDDKLSDSKICKICYINEYNAAFVPCGHVTCRKCGSSVDNCPQCRKAFFINISKRDQQNLKLQRLRVMLLKHLMQHFLKLYKDTFGEQWNEVNPSLQRKYFDEVFDHQFTSNKEKRESLKCSVNDLNESQLTTLIVDTYRKKEVPEYSGLPLAMEKYIEISSLLVHDYLNEEQAKFIWAGFEDVFSYLGVENASEDIRAIRDRNLRIEHRNMNG